MNLNLISSEVRHQVDTSQKSNGILKLIFIDSKIRGNKEKHSEV